MLNQSANNQAIGLNIELAPGDGAFPVGLFDAGGMTITDSGSISGAGMALTKVGSGTLVLSGSNTYSGGTYVTGGKLVVTAPDAILDGSNLYLGANAAAAFGTVVSADSTPASASSPAPVPEPSTLALLAAGVFVLLRRPFVARFARRAKGG